MTITITTKHLDEALKHEWSCNTCIVAQAVKESGLTIDGVGGSGFYHYPNGFAMPGKLVEFPFAVRSLIHRFDQAKLAKSKTTRDDLAKLLPLSFEA